jgi:basic amino acid/polyamine antiporter, APA family
VMGRAAPWFPPGAFIAITIFAVANTALINYVTASRLLYGMARDRRLPSTLARLHARRRTPHVAVVLILAVLIGLVLLGDISQLAAATVLLLLLVFAVVNSALVVLKLRPGEPKGAFEIPIAIPALGAIACLGLFLARMSSGDWRAPALAGVILAIAAVLFAIMRPDNTAPADVLVD